MDKKELQNKKLEALLLFRGSPIIDVMQIFRTFFLSWWVLPSYSYIKPIHLKVWRHLLITIHRKWKIDEQSVNLRPHRSVIQNGKRVCVRVLNSFDWNQSAPILWLITVQLLQTSLIYLTYLLIELNKNLFHLMTKPNSKIGMTEIQIKFFNKYFSSLFDTGGV